MSDANRTAVAFVEETTPGTTPATPAWANLRIKAADFKYDQSKIQSDELRADRQVTGLILVGAEASGSLPLEWSYGAGDELFKGALASAWVNSPYRFNTSSDTPISDVTATAITITAAPGVPNGEGAFGVGHLIQMSGFGGANNNSLKRLTAATATTLTTSGMTIETVVPVGARIKTIAMQGTAGDIGFTAGGTNTINRSAGTMDFTTLFAPGVWLKVGGATGAALANNGWCRVSAVVAATLTLDAVPTGWVTDAGTGMTISLYCGDYLRNGTTKRSYAFEEQFQDLVTPEFQYWNGFVCGGMEMGLDQQAIAQLSFNFLGLTATIGTARFAGSTDKASDYYTSVLPPTGEVLNTTSHVGRIAENGTSIAGPNWVTSAGLTINNTLRRRTAIGSLGSVDIAMGRCVVTGKLSLFYGNKTILDRIRANTNTSWDIRLIDATGTRGYVVDCPLIKLNTGDPTVSGVDTDRMIEPEFQAIRHPTLGYTVQIMRFEQFA